MSSLVPALRGAVMAVAIALCAIVTVLSVPALASVTYAPAGAPQLSTESPAPGGAVAMSGSGFRAGSSVRAVIFSEPVVLGTVKADAAGVADVSVRIPSSFAPGSTHRLELQGVGADGEVHVLSQTVRLAGGDGVLAYTGAAVVPVLAVAGLVLVGGGALIAVGRRRAGSDA